MLSQSVKVLNKVGIHARPASSFVSEASKYVCNITIKKGENIAPAKSITRILRLRIQMGNTITIECDGPDEEKAISALVKLIESKFGEE